MRPHPFLEPAVRQFAHAHPSSQGHCHVPRQKKTNRLKQNYYCIKVTVTVGIYLIASAKI